ncbi:unnamed protein product [Protopolystoma xenopodis]|uniref:Uncharacterized protein n=1 Tax=Protopolystoma xenopodis TaxID=117903 RepID=A0A3S5B527_9PLAT|nr:unnamed protein product [Protopolystoma xenopodis]
MRDFEAFQDALSARQPGYGGPPEAVDSGGCGGVAGGPLGCSPYMASLTSSMCLVLDEFYTNLRCCGVSSITGEGMSRLIELVDEAKQEYFNVSITTTIFYSHRFLLLISTYS